MAKRRSRSFYGLIALFTVVAATVVAVVVLKLEPAIEAPRQLDPSIAMPQMIREAQTVHVFGVDEMWLLQWLTIPHPECDVATEMWHTVPCEGFAYGEAGRLDLVRLRDGHEYDR